MICGLWRIKKFRLIWLHIVFLFFIFREYVAALRVFTLDDNGDVIHAALLASKVFHPLAVTGQLATVTDQLIAKSPYVCIELPDTAVETRKCLSVLLSRFVRDTHVTDLEEQLSSIISSRPGEICIHWPNIILIYCEIIVLF